MKKKMNAYMEKREIAVRTAAKITGTDAAIIREGMKKGAEVAPENRKAVNLAKTIWYKYRKNYAVAKAAQAEAPAKVEAK